MKKALVFYSFRASFVAKDIDILTSEYRVLEHNFYTTKKYLTPLKFISQKLFLLKNIVGADLLICQFAGYHSLLPALFAKIFNKPCVIIVGGTDAHCFPNIGYGNWQKNVVKQFTSLSLKLCSHIAPKHKSLMKSEYTYTTGAPNPQGIYAMLPNLKTPFTEITNGYDSVKWHRTANKVPKTFLTISLGWGFGFQYQLKGIDLMVEAASAYPDCTFTIIGMADQGLIPNKPDNLKVLPPVKNEELIALCSQNTYYLQLSMAEGFPNSLCEAMLCECVPIGSNVFSIPEIIGQTGFVLQHRNADELKNLIGEALKADTIALGQAARQQISSRYTYQMRKEKLLNLCKTLTTR